jgi:hypothetical protein
MLIPNCHVKILLIKAKLKKCQNHVIKEALLLIWSLVETEDRSRAVSPRGGSLQERGTKTGVSVCCVFASLKVDLVIPIHLSITLVNFLRKVTKTALLQYENVLHVCVNFLIITLLI